MLAFIASFVVVFGNLMFLMGLTISFVSEDAGPRFFSHDNRLQHVVPGNKPNQLCIYSPEPLIEMNSLF